MEQKLDCYIGLNDKGTIVAAMMMRADDEAEIAAILAAWVVRGLVIQAANHEEAREKFMVGELSQPSKTRYHVRVLVQGKRDFILVDEGDEELLEEYHDWETYDETPEWMEDRDDAEEEEADTVPDNQMRLPGVE